MSEIRINDIPITLINYASLIILEKSPYIDIVKQILKEMEFHYRDAQKDGQSEVSYAINPIILQEELAKKIQDEKLTDINICRTIQALCYASKLREGKEFFRSTRPGGGKTYHIVVNQRTLNACSRIL